MLVSDLASRPARPARSRVLRLRGLPYRALEDEIFRFLEPLIVTRVHLCRRNGRTTGEAYVQFENRHGAGEALRSKNRQHLGNRYIEIFEAGDSDIGHTDDGAGNGAPGISDLAQHAEPITAVKVAGLSSTATAQDVVTFLDGVELRRGLDSVVFFGDQGSGSRAALVELADDSALQLALSKNNQIFGEARLQLLQLTASETALFLQASAPGFSLPEGKQHAGDWSRQQQLPAVRAQQAAPLQFSTDGSTLKLRGLPYSASVSDVLHFFEGFHLNTDSIHLETKDDGQGNLTGTGLAYVQFAHPAQAEQARQNKHKQMMGTRYIECMIFVPGRPYVSRATAAPEANGHLPSPFHMQPRPDASGPQPAGASSMFPARMPDVSVGSLGWSRPYSPTLPFPARSAFESRPPPASFQQAADQAMQQGWGGQQWQGGVTPLGLAQGWIRPYPMGMPQAGPLQLPPMGSRGPIQGGMGLGMSGEGVAYGYTPGPGYAWAPVHPATPPMMGADVQAFPTGQQGGLGAPYPPGLNLVDSRLAQSPHGGRTPGRGNFRTPFSHQPQSRSSQIHPGSMTQRSPDLHVPSQIAVSAELSSGESATAGVITSLEALSVADELGGRRLSPIMTHAVLSPSDVILASAARSRAAELTAVTLAQMTEPFPPASAPVLGNIQSELAVTPAVVPTNASDLGNRLTATSQPETAFATAKSV
ncbi:MAG: hypothetical protein FRX49_11724 [Trebouxia sp. A1-2]|nr:MAG: hypothetical protein FRX49_11724 [Trebouxia sp. A1-2]